MVVIYFKCYSNIFPKKLAEINENSQLWIDIFRLRFEPSTFQLRSRKLELFDRDMRPLLLIDLQIWRQNVVMHSSLIYRTRINCMKCSSVFEQIFKRSYSFCTLGTLNERTKEMPLLTSCLSPKPQTDDRGIWFSGIDIKNCLTNFSFECFSPP